MPERPLRIVELASEAAPYAKTGGLADSVGALSKALARLGHDVHLILPLYASIERARHQLQPAGFRVEFALSSAHQRSMEVYAAPQRPGEPKVWFLEHPFFDRLQLYGERGGSYPDNHLRFGAYCRAALELIRQRLPAPDVLHLHDWQTSLAAVELRAPGLQSDPGFSKTGLIFTLHNLAYAGAFDVDAISELGLPASLASPFGLEFYGRIAFLKGGLMYSNALTTVSPRYATEIQIPEFGVGFDALLRQRASQLTGILNGIDTDEWNPGTDAALSDRYDATDLWGKAKCKAAVQHELGLKEEPRAPLFAVVSRLAWQKGIDLVAELAESICTNGGQLAVLGTGEEGLEGWLTEVSRRLPGRCALRLDFNEGLAHRLIAGSDVLLVPSRYEPCGLTQMYAMRYGTVPVVRAVGGLDDTVEELDSARQLGTGFKFGAASASAFWAAIQRAFGAYAQPQVWGALARRGMARNFSWDHSAAEYVRVFRSVQQAG